MLVSTNLSENFYSEDWVKRLMAFAFLIFSIYYTGTLYIITMTAENAYNNLNGLAGPLRQKLGIKHRMILEFVIRIITRARDKSSRKTFSRIKAEGARKCWTILREWILRDQPRHSD